MQPNCVLHENILLHKYRPPDRKDPDQQRDAGPGVYSVLRAAVLKRAGVAEQDDNAGKKGHHHFCL